MNNKVKNLINKYVGKAPKPVKKTDLPGEIKLSISSDVIYANSIDGIYHVGDLKDLKIYGQKTLKTQNFLKGKCGNDTGIIHAPYIPEMFKDEK